MDTKACDYCGRPVEDGALRYGPAIPGPRHWECNNVKNGKPSTIEDIIATLMKDMKNA
jgi:hypothetical protein